MKTAIGSRTPMARGLIVGVSLVFLPTIAAIAFVSSLASQPPAPVTISPASARQVFHRSMIVDDVEIFYREAGSRENPTVLLLHGFPTSSHMFRNLIPALADGYHVVAPDYPGFGYSSMPAVDEFDYTFERLAEIVESFVDQLGLESYSLYLMDYGAPVGYRLAAKYPDRVESLIVQNGNAYEEGLREFWDPIKKYWADRTPENAEALRGLLTIDATKWQYFTGVRDSATISPDNWGHVQPLLETSRGYEAARWTAPDWSHRPRSCRGQSVVARPAGGRRGFWTG